MRIHNKNEEKLYLNQEPQETLALSPENSKQMQRKSIVVEEVLNDNDFQLQAAYALNLCSVSVSQIVDYNDIYILEQEYELILNNLNIENMPKDEPLLNILKQILDTITFFRIQEGDKEFIQKEYQEKMKSAIWSAVPNIGVIVASGNPVAMVTSLASQVGIGYMNYRKEKSKAGLDLERQKWQLQRSAIEQFNGLRRELFDTAWRLADKYKFPDNYRLTEKQITHYNAILMESHPIRKYDRLAAIEDKFKAYPSFLYQIGNAANEIYRSKNYDDTIKIRFKNLAISYFEKYININKYDLLRENQIAASCALEYIDLLDINKDRNKIKTLLNYAINSSSEVNDVLELCALEYLKLGDNENASILLKRLVNEDYNPIINSQILSSIYVYNYINTNSVNIKTDYKLLSELIAPEYLFPMPEVNENIEVLEFQFLNFQKQILNKKYMKVLKEFADIYTVKFNKVIPLPNNREYSDYFYSDELECRTIRFNMIRCALMGDKSHSYIETLKEAEIEIGFLNILNEMYFNIIKLGNFNSFDAKTIKGILKETYVNKKKDDLNEFRTKVDNFSSSYSNYIYKILNSLTFMSFVKDFYKEVLSTINNYIYKLSQINDFMISEGILRTFCIGQNIPVPEVLYNHNKTINKTIETFIFEESMGSLNEMKKEKELKDKMESCISDRTVEISTKAVKFITHIPNLKKQISGTSIDEDKFLGYLDDKKIDLYFTTEKLHVFKNDKEKCSAFYNEIKFDEKEKIIYKDKLDFSTSKDISNKKLDGINDVKKAIAKAAKLGVAAGVGNAGIGVAAKIGIGAVGGIGAVSGIGAVGVGAAGLAAIVKKLNENKESEFEYAEKGNNIDVSKLYMLIKKLIEINPNVKLSNHNCNSKEKLDFKIVDNKIALTNDPSHIYFAPDIGIEEHYD